MSEDKCFYCNDTGYIKGKEIPLKDRLPDQMCPYCEIGQAVIKGYNRAKARCDKLVKVAGNLLSAIGPKGYFPAAGYTRTKALRQALKEIE